MKRAVTSTLLTALALILAPRGLWAQRYTTPETVEVGMDGGLQLRLTDPTASALQLPFQSIRVGFPINGRWSVEPSVSFSYRHFSATASLPAISQTSIELTLGTPYVLPGATDQRGGYVRPFFGVASGSASPGGGADDAFILGGGIGYKIAVLSQMSWRLEANWDHYFGGGDPSLLNLLFGVSLFVR